MLSIFRKPGAIKRLAVIVSIRREIGYVAEPLRQASVEYHEYWLENSAFAPRHQQCSAIGHCARQYGQAFNN